MKTGLGDVPIPDAIHYDSNTISNTCGFLNIFYVFFFYQSVNVPGLVIRERQPAGGNGFRDDVFQTHALLSCRDQMHGGRA